MSIEKEFIRIIEDPVQDLETKAGEVIDINEIKKEYLKIIESKDIFYDSIEEKYPRLKGMRDNLEMHEKIVEKYGNELIDAHSNLTTKEKITAIIAVIFHDIGKMDSLFFEDNKEWLLNHHKRGSEKAGELLEQLKGQKIGRIEIDEQMIEKVKQAINRHMNHPYLISLKGDRFEEPEDDIDKIVSDADMMANVGFKNIAFRFNDKSMTEDKEAAEKKSEEENRKVAILESSFDNVMDGVKALKNYVFSKPAKENISGLIEKSETIFEYLKENDVFIKVQKEFSINNENFNMTFMEDKFGKDFLLLIKKRLNKEIVKAGNELDIDKNVFNNFLM